MIFLPPSLRAAPGTSARSRDPLRLRGLCRPHQARRGRRGGPAAPGEPVPAADPGEEHERAVVDGGGLLEAAAP